MDSAKLESTSYCRKCRNAFATRINFEFANHVCCGPCDDGQFSVLDAFSTLRINVHRSCTVSAIAVLHEVCSYFCPG